MILFLFVWGFFGIVFFWGHFENLVVRFWTRGARLGLMHLSGFEIRFQANWAYVILAETGPADKEQLRSAATTGNDEQACMSEVNDRMSEESDFDL